ncbi:MAG: CPXCG motif-containing cysteine-rich protein [Gemmatimonadota bacterium]
MDLDAVGWCPYCGEPVEVELDPYGGALQTYVEDCPVCCRPWQVEVSFDRNGQASVRLEAGD